MLPVFRVFFGPLSWHCVGHSLQDALLEPTWLMTAQGVHVAQELQNVCKAVGV